MLAVRTPSSRSSFRNRCGHGLSAAPGAYMRVSGAADAVSEEVQMKTILRTIGILATAALPIRALAEAPSPHPMQPTAGSASATQESEIVWLRRRVEQLEAMLASGANCSSAQQQQKKSMMKSKGGKGGMPDSSMPMNDDDMGSGTMAKPKSQPKSNGSMGSPGSMGHM